MKVAIFTDTYEPQTNGAVDSINKFKKELEKRGHEVYIFCPYDKELKKKKNVIPLRSIKFSPYPEYRIGIPSARIIRHIRRIQPDIIHIQSPATIGLAGLAVAKYYNIPTIATYHTLLTEYFSYISTKHEKMSKRSIIKFTKWFFNKVDRVLVPSTSIKKILQKYGIKKPIDVVMTGIYLEKRRLSKKKKSKIPTILHVGRICKEKRIDFVIKGFKRLLRRRDARLVITSDGPDRDRLEKMVTDLGIEDKVTFTGYVSDRKRDQLYRDADVFVTASKTETQGIVLVEALSIGCPVVVQNSLGFKDVIKDGYNGFMFRSEGEMIRKITKILDDKKLRNKFRFNGRESAKELTVEKTTDKLFDVYYDLAYSKKISVIIPTYKEEKYIKKTLLSVKNQKYPNYETIVVDSNSPDRTRTIARKYANKVINLRERGISKGRNTGAKVATGDILLFLDADTVLQPDFLKHISVLFNIKRTVGASGYIKTKGKAIDRLIYALCSEVAWVLSKIRQPRFYGMCIAVRKDIFDRIGGFNEALHTAEDMEFTKDMNKYGKCILHRNAIAYTSPRRIAGMGTVNAVMFHTKNFINYSLFRKPAKDYPTTR